MALFRNLARKPPDRSAATAPTLDPTPIYISPRVRLVLIIATFVIIYLLASAAPSIPRLLMLGATLALILSFPVRMLNRWVPRGWAIAIAVGTTLLMLVLLLLLIVPFIISEVSDIIQAMPELAENAQRLTRDAVTEMNHRGLIRQNPDDIYDTLESTLIDRGQALIETALAAAVNTLTQSINVLISAFAVFFIATYLLVDIPRFRQTFVNAFASRYHDDIAHLWTTLGESLSRYLSGLLVSITLQGLFAGVGLLLIGVPYAAIFGIWMTLTAVLPYIGAFLGAIPAVAVALTISWQHAVVTVLLYVFINQLEANFITPRIQGNAVRVHPLLIFIAVLLGSELGGVFGAIIAVPALAVVRVLTEFFWMRLRVRGPHDTFLAAIGGDIAPDTSGVLSVRDPDERAIIRPDSPEARETPPD